MTKKHLLSLVIAYFVLPLMAMGGGCLLLLDSQDRVAMMEILAKVILTTILIALIFNKKQ